MRAIIAGGGIGGLATALGLRRVGWDVLVLERAPEIREVGAAVALWSNGVLALRQLGLENRVRDLGASLYTSRTIDAAGRVLSTADVGGISHRMGAPTVCIHRATLQGLLAATLEPHTLRTGSPVVRFEQHEGGVDVFLASGVRHSADILIGADGVNSVVRSRLFGAAEPRYAGYTCWRGVARVPESVLPRGESLLALGAGSQFGMSWCGPDHVYWFATKNAPRHTPDGPHGRKIDVLHTFRDWCEPAITVMRATAEAQILKNDIVDRPPLPQWTRDRVTLLGDAAHPATPNLGQGACLALEDAVVLAGCMRSTASVTSALHRYEAQRRPRCHKLGQHAWWLGRLLQTAHPAVVSLRNRFLSSQQARRRSVEWLAQTLPCSLPTLPLPSPTSSSTLRVWTPPIKKSTSA